MKKMLTCLFIFSLLSFSALAAVPSPSEAFSGLGGFFTGLFTGASSDNLYLLTFLLYFILLMLLFLEGIRYLPIFGGTGESSAAGKWFAVAAAGLSTISIFIAEQTTGKSTKEIISGLMSPWGIYGGLAIAGFFAGTAYHVISNMDYFKEKTMMKMAIAASIGLSVTGFLLSKDTFLAWSYVILFLVFIVGFGSSWFIHRADTAGDRADRTEEKAEKKKESSEKRKKETVKKGKKAFARTMSEFIVEKNELEIFKEIDRIVKDIKKKKAGLEATTEPSDKTEAMFEALAGEIQEAIEDNEEATKLWRKSRGINRTTFKQQRELKGFIEVLEKEDVDPAKIQELRAKEALILERHRETKIKIDQLVQILKPFKETVSKAAKLETPDPSEPEKTIFDLNGAKGLISDIDFQPAEDLIVECVQLQGNGTPTNPGVVKIIESVIADLRGFS